MNDARKLTAYVVRVTRVDADVLGGNLVLFYAVLADTPEQALTLVEDSIPPDDSAELQDGTLSAETVKSIGLRPREPQVL